MHLTSEFLILSNSGCGEHRDTIFSILLKSEDGQQNLSVTYSLGKDYPQVCPSISLGGDGLRRETCHQIRKDAIKFVKENNLTSQPMIMDINMWLQQNMSQYFEFCHTSASEKTSSGKEKEELWQALLHVDHMRARTKYVKIIEKWTSELRLTGHLIFSDKLILILLCGSQQYIKVKYYVT